MEQSNLKLFSNVFPWKGRGREGDQEFISKILDDKALRVLKIAEQKRELVMSRHQEELYKCTIQCPHLPQGERPWGWVDSGVVGCRCRKERCPLFSDCRHGSGLTEAERKIWLGGNQDGLIAFERTWRQNREPIENERDRGAIDVRAVLSHDAYETVPQPAGKRATPQIASGYPDDEEYE